MKLALCVALLVVAACAPRQVTIENLTRIETEKKFVWADPSQTPTMEQGRVVLEGERLEEVMRGAQCKEGASPWTGGVRAMLTFKLGAPLQADGFSESGRRLRIHQNQWCQLTEEGWSALWREKP